MVIFIDGRRSRPLPFDRVGLVRAGPCRYRHSNHFEYGRPGITELEVRPSRNHQRNARYKLDSVFFTFSLAPHLPAPMNNVPEFFDSVMGDG